MKLFKFLQAKPVTVRPYTPQAQTGLQLTGSSMAGLVSQLTRRNWTTSRWDSRSWQDAYNQATSFLRPDRRALLAIYRKVLNDAHLKSVANTRLLKLQQQPYRWSGPQGEERRDIGQLIDPGLLEEFVGMALESKYWGHSLIDLVFAGGVLRRVELVPREHVRPETGEVLLDALNFAGGVNYRRNLVQRLGQEVRGAYRIATNEVLIELGKNDDLGLLCQAAKNVIDKWNAMEDWAEWSERFGMPLRVLHTQATDTRKLDEYEHMLQEMGTAGWALLGEMDKLTLAEASKTDAYQVYYQRVLFLDYQNSKLFGGQTMTSDNGSSRAQAEVHERVLGVYTDADKRYIESVINRQLLPVLASYNPQLEGIQFSYRAYENMNQLQRADLYTKLSALGFALSPEQIQEEFGIQLLGDGPAA